MSAGNSRDSESEMRFGEVHVLPKVFVDASGWNWDCIATKLALRVMTDENTKVEEAMLPLQETFASIDRFDRDHGGDGFEVLSKLPGVDELTLEIVPRGSKEIEARLRRAVRDVDTPPSVLIEIM